MKKGAWLLFITAFLCFAFVMATVLLASSLPSTSENIHLSVVMYGSENNDRWVSLDQGIRQACRELAIENPVIVTTPVGDAAQQAQLVEREIAAGAKGLIIAAEAGDAGALEALAKSVPSVFVKNGVGDMECISADPEAMAGALAERLAGEGRDVVVLTEGVQRATTQRRLEAFLGAMGAVEVVEADSPETLRKAILMRNNGGQTHFVCLETGLLEKAIDMVSELPMLVRLSGIGSSDKVVHALNQGVVQGIVFENEYAIGYLATMRLAEKLGLTRDAPDEPIQWMYVDRAAMFQPEAEHLLFPIIQ